MRITALKRDFEISGLLHSNGVKGNKWFQIPVGDFQTAMFRKWGLTLTALSLSSEQEWLE